MVNGGFTERARHGFEKVDAATIAASGADANRHQSKIYGSHRLARFLREFSPH
jgi:hypothetical protein